MGNGNNSIVIYFYLFGDVKTPKGIIQLHFCNGKNIHFLSILRPIV